MGIVVSTGGDSVDGVCVDVWGDSVLVTLLTAVVWAGVVEVDSVVCHDEVVFTVLGIELEDGNDVVGVSVVEFDITVLSVGIAGVGCGFVGSTDVEFCCVVASGGADGVSSDGSGVVMVAALEVVAVVASPALVVSFEDDPVVASLVIEFSVVVGVLSPVVGHT